MKMSALAIAGFIIKLANFQIPKFATNDPETVSLYPFHNTPSGF